jgi:NADPH:quinone reductase-like Zn-dependent oxidoreductase
VNRRYGTPEVLERVDLEVPSSEADEIVVRVHAAAANALDWHVLTGTPDVLRLAAGLRRPRRVVRTGVRAGHAELRTLVRMVEQGTLRSVIDRRFPLRDTADALRHLSTGHARGEVVVIVAAAEEDR